MWRSKQEIQREKLDVMLRKEKSTIRTTRLQRKKECGELPDRAALPKNFSQMNPDYDPIQEEIH